jgi:hypothetical protein
MSPLRMVCACATGSWAISALVGSFDLKWRSDRRSRDSEEGSLGWGARMGNGSCAIFPLVGPFHRKWRHQTSPDPFGVPLEGWDARMRNRKLCNIHYSKKANAGNGCACAKHIFVTSGSGQSHFQSRPLPVTWLPVAHRSSWNTTWTVPIYY